LLQFDTAKVDVNTQGWFAVFSCSFLIAISPLLPQDPAQPLPYFAFEWIRMKVLEWPK